MADMTNAMGLSGESTTWAELDDVLKKDVLKKTAEGVGFSILYVIYVIISFTWLTLFGGLLVIMAYFGLVYYNYLQYTHGKYAIIEGHCVKINKPVASGKLLNVNFSMFGAASVVLRTANGTTVEAPISHIKDILPGYDVKVYFKENNLYQKEADYYKIISPIAVNITGTKDADINKE